MPPDQELASLEQSIDQLLLALEERYASGQPLSEDLKLLLAQEISTTLSRIEQLRALPEIAQAPISEAPQVPDKARLLWILSGGNTNAFRSYLSTFPDPELNQLAQNQGAFNYMVGFLQREEPIPTGEAADGVSKAPLQSSNIYGFQYDPRSRRLLVRFQPGSVYQYTGVPPEVFKIFQAGAVPAKTKGRNRYGMWYVGKIPSLGAAFHELVKLGGYPYERLK